jgi:hypothetical protein
MMRNRAVWTGGIFFSSQSHRLCGRVESAGLPGAGPLISFPFPIRYHRNIRPVPSDWPRS